jgi:hypothetical protein
MGWTVIWKRIYRGVPSFTIIETQSYAWGSRLYSFLHFFGISFAPKSHWLRESCSEFADAPSPVHSLLLFIWTHECTNCIRWIRKDSRHLSISVRFQKCGLISQHDFAVGYVGPAPRVTGRAQWRLVYIFGWQHVSGISCLNLRRYSSVCTRPTVTFCRRLSTGVETDFSGIWSLSWSESGISCLAFKACVELPYACGKYRLVPFMLLFI